MADQTMNAPDIEVLREGFRGEIITPDHEDYDKRRHLFNLLHDKRPAVIARCAGTADVIKAVGYARAADLEIAVRSGGRHMAGFAGTDGGLVIDLGAMRSVKVDPEDKTAWVQTGANGGDLQAEALTHGLAAVTGWTAGTGVGGVCLGGGFGMLSGKMGFAADNMLELELVTAEGKVLRVSPDTDPELFWGLRGAAPNFGVVTWIKMRLQPVPDQVLAGEIVYSGEQGPDVLRFLGRLAQTRPAELNWLGDFSVAPDDPEIPEELRGELIFSVIPVHMGELDQAEADLQSLLEAHPPLFADVQPRGLFEFMLYIETFIPELRQWYDGVTVRQMSDDVVEAIEAQLPAMARMGSTAFLQTYPIAPSLEGDGEDALPFGYHAGGYGIGTVQFWEDPADDALHQEWSDAAITALRNTGHTTDETNGNIQQLPDVERQRRSYGEATWKRLIALKAKYDPENIFHLNHNIPPAV